MDAKRLAEILHDEGLDAYQTPDSKSADFLNRVRERIAAAILERYEVRERCGDEKEDSPLYGVIFYRDTLVKNFDIAREAAKAIARRNMGDETIVFQAVESHTYTADPWRVRKF